MLRDESTIDTIVVHCADTPDGVPYTIWDIDEWHKARGFKRDPRAVVDPHNEPLYVGYHRVYGLGGFTWEGRSLAEVGAHVKGHNETSVGLCLIGRERFTLVQWQSLRADVEDFLRRFSGARVLGHRQLNPQKTCPGFDVDAWLAGGMQPLEGHVL